MHSPLPWGEGGPLPALSSAGAGRVRGHFASGKTKNNSNSKGQMDFQFERTANCKPFEFCHLPFEFALSVAQRRNEEAPHPSADG
jgi:hypothetical protein